MTKEQILAEALALDAQERTALADALWTSLGIDERSAVDAAWLDESRRRDEAYQRGEIGASTIDEVIDRVRSRVRR